MGNKKWDNKNVKILLGRIEEEEEKAMIRIRDPKLFGKRVEIQRRKLGLDIETLSRLSKITVDNLKAIEKGISRPPVITIARIATALNLSVEELVGKNGFVE